MRTYSTEEVEQIVSLATKMQVQFREQATLVEIEKAAAEFGVDPRFVQLAAQELDKKEVPRKSTQPEFASIPFNVLVICYVLTLVPAVAIVRGFQVFGGLGWLFAACFFLFTIGLSFPVKNVVRILLVPMVATAGVLAVLSVCIAFGLGPSFQSSWWANEQAIWIAIQLLVALVGFGISRFVEMMLSQRDRGMTMGR